MLRPKSGQTQDKVEANYLFIKDLNNVLSNTKPTVSVRHEQYCISDRLQSNKLITPFLRYMLSFSRVAFSFRGKGNVSKAYI